MSARQLGASATAHLEDTEPGKGQTALVFAARAGASKCLQMLADGGANVDATMAAGAMTDL